MQRISEKLFSFAEFDHSSKIHDHHPIGYVPDNAQSMRNKQICQIILFLQIFEKIDDLSLN